MKRLLLFTALVFTFTTAQSQEVRFGAKLGLNASYIGGDTENASLGIKAGLHLGGVWEVPFSKKFALQPELLYSLEIYDYGTLLTSANVSSSYVRVPFLAKYYLFKGLSIEVGPTFGFLIASKIEGTDVKDSFKTIDVAVAIGTTYELNSGLFFSARYNLGLTNINDFDGSDIKNQANNIQISVGHFL